MSLQVWPPSVLISTTPPSRASSAPFESMAVSNQYRWRKLMRSGRVSDTDIGGDISEASVWLTRSFACHRCCVGVISSTLHALAFVHAVCALSKSSDALCFGSSCTLRRNADVDVAAPAMKSGSVTDTVTFDVNAAVPDVSVTLTVPLTVCPGSLAGRVRLPP